MPHKTSSDPPSAPAADPLCSRILDTIGEGVFSVDRSFRITFFNAEAERITGFARENALGRTCFEVFRASNCQSNCPLRQAIRTGQRIRNVRVDVLDANLDPLPICVCTAVLTDEEGKPVGGVETFRDVSEQESLRREAPDAPGYRDIVGHSPEMRRICSALPDIATSDATVLITGPSGSGKALIARAIHELSPRHARPFVRINCGALPDLLLESELFGHARGAFSSARRDKSGRFVLADGGTLFLDEASEISPSIQAKLLHVLQEGELQPVGAPQTIPIDVRVIAATNLDLAQAVVERSFRQDLYSRLRIVPIDIPPLAARRQDIPPLVEQFVRDTSRRTGKPVAGMTEPALDVLCNYHFPGNVRELKHVVERALGVCREGRIDVHHLPDEVFAPSGAPHGRPPGTSDDAGALRAALDAHRWNRTATAKALGIGRNTLWRRMKRLGLIQS